MDGLTEVRFEVDGETVTGGTPGETWYAIYRVPVRVARTEITEVEAEEYDIDPRFEKAVN